MSVVGSSDFNSSSLKSPRWVDKVLMSLLTCAEVSSCGAPLIWPFTSCSATSVVRAVMAYKLSRLSRTDPIATT